jgi:hypothetical protein
MRKPFLIQTAKQSKVLELERLCRPQLSPPALIRATTGHGKVSHGAKSSIYILV